MIKSQEKAEKIDEMIDLFSRIITALTIIRDKDVSETKTLKDLGINKNTFRRVVYDMNWEDLEKPDRAAFKKKFKESIPTRNWAEDLFCDVMGLPKEPSSCGKIPEDVKETMEIIVNECLNETDQKIIECLYKECLTLDEASGVIGKTPERIRQIRDRIFKKLRSRNRQAYIVYGEEYFLKEKEVREKVLNDFYVDRLQKELLRLEDLISYRKHILDGTPVPKRDIRLEDLGLSVRAYNCLWRAGIRTLGDIAAHSEVEIMRVRNLGRKCFDEVTDMLYARGYHYREE